MRILSAIATLSLLGIGAFAQTPSANPLTSGMRTIYNMSKNDVLKSAEEMPEENYSFRPVSTVRTFGELVAHVADAQYEFCGPVAADGTKSPGVEKNKTSKADIIAALKTAFAYCDKTYDGLTDSQAADPVHFFGSSTKLVVLSFNNAHNMEHYGNMVTYLRIKGLVPPSSKK